MKNVTCRHLELVVLLLVLGGFAESLVGAAVVIKGHLKVWDMINDNRRLSYEEEYRVSLDSISHLWCIEDLSDPPKAAFTFRDFVLARENSAPSIRMPIFAASAFYDNGYPIDLDQDQRTLWFAYCGAEFAKQHQSQPVILLDQDARSDVRVYGCRARMQWRSASDLCPEKAAFVISSDLLTNLTRELSWQAPGDSLEVRAKAVQTYVEWATNGFLRSSFAVERWMNVGGVGVPRNWNVTYFGRQGGPDRIFEGRTDSVDEGSTVTLPVSKEMQLRDLRVRRLGRLNYVSYNVTDGQIPSENDPKLIKLSAKFARDAYRQMPHDLRKPRSILYILFVILLAIGPILFFVKRRERTP